MIDEMRQAPRSSKSQDRILTDLTRLFTEGMYPGEFNELNLDFDERYLQLSEENRAALDARLEEREKQLKALQEHVGEMEHDDKINLQRGLWRVSAIKKQIEDCKAKERGE